MVNRENHVHLLLRIFTCHAALSMPLLSHFIPSPPKTFHPPSLSLSAIYIYVLMGELVRCWREKATFPWRLLHHLPSFFVFTAFFLCFRSSDAYLVYDIDALVGGKYTIERLFNLKVVFCIVALILNITKCWQYRHCYKR